MADSLGRGKNAMTQLQVRSTTLGGHVHVDVFVRTLPTETWSKSGTLVFEIEEWDAVKPRFEPNKRCWANTSGCEGQPEKDFSVPGFQWICGSCKKEVKECGLCGRPESEWSEDLTSSCEGCGSQEGVE